MKQLFLKAKILSSYYQGLHNHKDSVLHNLNSIFLS